MPFWVVTGEWGGQEMNVLDGVEIAQGEGQSLG